MLIPTELYVDGNTEEKADKDVLSLLGLESIGLKKTPEIILEARRSDLKKSTEIGVIKGFVSSWLESLPADFLSEIGVTISDLLTNCPKRWSVYQPMVLLPAGSFRDQAWIDVLHRLHSSQRSGLWAGIIDAVSSKEGDTLLTHLAINCGIPLTKSSATEEQNENILRSPSGLIMLHGDWGPDLTGVAGDAPSENDFRTAFWVSTKQNGIHQTWAPRYTMFSRGNIKEKARILSFHDFHAGIKAARTVITPGNLQDAIAVDLYAGIGYFAFSYAQIGMSKVLCWEINPWSVEGLRRGIELNGWSYQIIKGDCLTKPLKEQLNQETKIVVFEETNEHAAARIEAIRREEYDNMFSNHIMHVNCGFLPTSEPSWKTAWKILGKGEDGWLHLHENVAVDDVEKRRKGIETDIRDWAVNECSSCVVEVEHVEFVKTFAPEVWHVVFDVHVSSREAPNEDQ